MIISPYRPTIWSREEIEGWMDSKGMSNLLCGAPNAFSTLRLHADYCDECRRISEELVDADTQ